MVFALLSNRWVLRFGNKIVVTTGLLIVATSLVLFITLQPDTGALHLILITMVMGLGMANVMAPCTDSIMGSLPRAKAGVGSAVNDTTRQVGGALGVAIIGSVYSSVYAGSISSAIAGKGLPAAAEATVTDSIGGAMGVAKSVGGQAGDALAAAAKTAFVSGMHRGVLVGAVIALAGALVALLFLPARAPETADEGIDPSEPNTFGLVDGEDIDDLVGAGIAAGVGAGAGSSSTGAGARPGAGRDVADGAAFAEA